jgi:hypothetical protein
MNAYSGASSDRFAMYATGIGVRSAPPGHFDWFDYQAA